MDPTHITHTCAKPLGGFLLPVWKGARSAPYKCLCTFSSDQTTAWKKMQVGALVDLYRPWLVGNIVLDGQPQIVEGRSSWPKYCIKWGPWKAGVEKAGVQNATRYGRSWTVFHLCNRLQWIKRLISGARDYKSQYTEWSKNGYPVLFRVITSVIQHRF